MTHPELAERARLFAEAALSLKARDVVGLDVHELTSFADTFLIATGTSDRHVCAVADAVVAAAKARGERPLGIEGYDDGEWVLIDMGDVIVHVFQHETRERFDLERLWADAPTLLFGEPEPGDVPLRVVP